jgi:HK97 family phage portal protein
MLDALKRYFRTDPTLTESKATPLEVVLSSVKRMVHTGGVTTINVKGAQITPIEAVFGGLLAGMNTSELRSYQSYLTVGSRKVWASWKSCDLIGNVIMDTPMDLIREGGEGQPVTHPLLSPLLQNPNPFETWGEFVYRWLFHIKLTGNAFWYKSEANLAGARPKALYQLNPKLIQLVIDPKLGLIGYNYTHPRGMVIPFDREEVIHFKRPHPDKEFWGLGDIEAGEPLYQEHLNRSEWSQKFWKNGASPSGILICEDAQQQFTDKDKFAEAKKRWQKEYGGTENSGKTAWLTGKWKYEKLGLSGVEMQNIESEQWSVEQIFLQHGIPLTVAGLKDAANYATARQDDLRFRRYTVKPHLRWLGQRLRQDLLAGYDPRLMLQFNVAGLTDINQIAEDWMPLFDRGVVSINEIRRMANLEEKTDDPLFDQHFVNSSLVPLDIAGIQPVDTQAQEIAKRALHEHTKRRQ